MNLTVILYETLVFYITVYEHIQLPVFLATLVPTHATYTEHDVYSIADTITTIKYTQR